MFRGDLQNRRKVNTDREGEPFDKITVAQVWLRAQPVRGQDPRRIRADVRGAWIAFAEFGRRSPLGWQIDHVRPVVRGGGDEPGNLQALHWVNNHSKGNAWPLWDSAIRAWSEAAPDADLSAIRALRHARHHSATTRR
jgi:5-methylcytosine-specific restriction endonuclease McrA